MTLPSTKPYLIRALYEWCSDCGYTPHIVVTVDENTVVPQAHIHNGQITLNIADTATHNLVLGDDTIEFQARFGGATEQLYVPVAAVAAIYARETGAGMGFEVTPSAPDAGAPETEKGVQNAPVEPEPSSPAPRKSHLRLVQ